MDSIGLILFSCGMAALVFTMIYIMPDPKDYPRPFTKEQKLKTGLIGTGIALLFSISGTVVFFCAGKFEARFKANPTEYTIYMNNVEIDAASVDLDKYYYQYNEKRKEVYLSPKELDTKD